ncbi:ribosome maturation factor RimM [Convivina praedatoris]|nr:ribosome maturation factor RimM [Convivina sp. LMG 32447]
MVMEEKYYKVGTIVNTHGIRGEVKLKATTDFAQERFAKGQLVYLDKDQSQYQELVIKASRPHKGMWLLTFENYADINLVEVFKGHDLYVSGSQRQDLAAGEYYYDQIIGCQVVDLNQTVLGEIIDIFTTGANDVWTVRLTTGKEGLIPVIPDVVKDVDVAQKRITIDVLEGLFD